MNDDFYDDDPDFPEKVDGRALRWVKHRELRKLEFIELTCNAVRSIGYQVSVDQIAEYAKTSKSILYRYFPDKTSLQYEVGSHIIGVLVETIKKQMATQTTQEGMLRAAIDTYLDFMENDLDLYIFVRIGDLTGEPGNAKVLEFDEILLGATVADFEQNAERLLGEPSESRNEAVIAHLGSSVLVSLIRNVAETWLFSRRTIERPEDYPGFKLPVGDRLVAEMSRDEITNVILDFITNGILGSFPRPEAPVTAN